MTCKKWTTNDQEMWLKAHCDDFAKAEAINNTKSFFNEVNNAWHKKWPNPEPTNDDISKAGNCKQAVKLKCEWQRRYVCSRHCTHDAKLLPSCVLVHGSGTTSV